MRCFSKQKTVINVTLKSSILCNVIEVIPGFIIYNHAYDHSNLYYLIKPYFLFATLQSELAYDILITSSLH